MASQEICLTICVNRRRADAIAQEAIAKVNRAVKNERPAVAARYAQRLVRECFRVGKQGQQ